MKRKVLISGVLPSAFEGPWIPVGGHPWKYIPRQSFDEKVIIEAKSGEDVTPHHLNGTGFEFEGDFARGIVLDGLKGVSVVTVSIFYG